MRPLLLLLAFAANGALAQDEGRATADAIVVHKAARTLTVLDGEGRVVREFHGVQLGPDPVGAKHFQGDGRTPEGHYTIDYGNDRSAYHLALHISYPAPADRAFAAARGRAPGGLIMIHGQPNGWAAEGHGLRAPGDWTDGCIALSDAEIEQVWRLVGDDTPITILP